MTEFRIEFVEDRDDVTISAAETRAEAFRVADRRYDETPRDITEVEREE